mgnify:CR=1 FL=1
MKKGFLDAKRKRLQFIDSSAGLFVQFFFFVVVNLFVVFFVESVENHSSLVPFFMILYDLGWDGQFIL